MADIICMQCKYIGKPKRIKRGSNQLEMIGWMLFPFGLPYTLWRMIAKKPVCKMCESEFIMSSKSAVAQRLIRIASGGPAFETPTAPKPVKRAADAIMPEQPLMGAPVQLPPKQSTLSNSSTVEPAVHVIAAAVKTSSNLVSEEKTRKPSLDPDVW